MKKTFTAFALASIILASPLALAETDKTDPSAKPRYNAETHFKKMDTDGDGFINKKEMLDEHARRVDKMFDRLDTDKDGKLSKEEMEKGREKMKMHMKKKMDLKKD